MRERGRQQDYSNMARGEQVRTGKLTEAEVSDMRVLHAEGVDTVELGRLFGVSQAAAWNIVARKVWKHVP
jgi:hypothetical protein